MRFSKMYWLLNYIGWISVSYISHLGNSSLTQIELKFRHLHSIKCIWKCEMSRFCSGLNMLCFLNYISAFRIVTEQGGWQFGSPREVHRNISDNTANESYSRGPLDHIIDFISINSTWILWPLEPTYSIITIVFFFMMQCYIAMLLTLHSDKPNACPIWSNIKIS